MIGGCTKARKIWSNPYYYGVTVTRLFQKPKSDETPIPTYSIVYDPLDAFFKKTQLNRTCLSCDDVIIKFGSANFKGESLGKIQKIRLPIKSDPVKIFT